MTDDMMGLRALAEERCDAGRLREMVGLAARRADRLILWEAGEAQLTDDGRRLWNRR